MSAMQDPMIMQLVGQNPRAQAIQAAAMAHISEHVGFAYRQKIEQQLGMPLPPEGEQLPPQIELALSEMMAQAAKQVLQQSQGMAAQEQAQQQAQDPVIQMQMQEQARKDAETQAKIEQGNKKIAIEEQRLAVDAADKVDRTELEKMRIAVEAADKADKTEIAQAMAMNNAQKGIQ